MSKLYDLLSAVCSKIKKPDWDQNDPTAADYVKNRPFYTEKKVIIPETRFEDEYHVVDKKYGIIIGERYTVIWNGNEYSCIAVAGQYIIDGTTYTAPKLEVGGPGEADYGDIFESPPEYEINQTIFSSFYETGPNTVSVIQDAEIVKIPEKYLPDGYGSGGNADQSTEKYLGDLRRTPIYRCLNIYLDGDTTGMTKDNAVTLNILILDEYGNVKFDGKSKTAWQGSGSLQYPNKNLSLKLRDKNDEESKVKLSVFPEYATSTYHLKCNYADYSMVRNSVGAKMAMSFDDTVLPVDAPMVVSSIPAILYLNGEFNGCYTLNTKQDDDLFGMDTKDNPLTQIVYRSGLNGWNLSNFEYRSDGTETAETQAKLTRLLNFAKNSDDATFISDFESYLSLRNAINYWIFADAACASDSLLNNWTIATWDGNKWYMLWYDLDIIFGLFRNAGLSYHPSKPTTDLLPLQYTTPNPIWAKLYRNFFDEIRERYWELRNNGMLTPTAIVNQFRTFQSKWGTEWIQKDRAKWTGRLNKTDDIDMMYGWISERLAYLDAKYSEAEAPDIPEEPDEPEKTLTSISATYNGGDVAVGTAVTNLTGIVVTAHYSDGSTATVTDYSLSGAILEGNNTITVSYGGMTTTFSVTGVFKNDGEVLYQLETPVTFDGTNGIDTGVALHSSDKDFTILGDIVVTETVPSPLMVFYTRSLNLSGNPGFDLRMSASGSAITLNAITTKESTGKTFNNISPIVGAHAKFAYTHTKGTNAIDVKLKAHREMITGTINDANAFIVHNETVKLGSPLGTLLGSAKFKANSFSIYSKVLTDDEISEYLNPENTDSTGDVLLNSSWLIGRYSWNTKTGEETSVNWPSARSNKFSLKNRVYVANTAEQRWNVFVWNENGDYCGTYNGRYDGDILIAREGYKYAIAVNSGDATNINAVTFTPRAEVVGAETIEIDLAGLTWTTGPDATCCQATIPEVNPDEINNANHNCSNRHWPDSYSTKKALMFELTSSTTLLLYGYTPAEATAYFAENPTTLIFNE